MHHYAVYWWLCRIFLHLYKRTEKKWLPLDCTFQIKIIKTFYIYIYIFIIWCMWDKKLIKNIFKKISIDALTISIQASPTEVHLRQSFNFLVFPSPSLRQTREFLKRRPTAFYDVYQQDLLRDGFLYDCDQTQFLCLIIMQVSIHKCNIWDMVLMNFQKKKNYLEELGY